MINLFIVTFQHFQIEITQIKISLILYKRDL